MTAYCTSLRAEVSTQTNEAGTLKEMRDFSLLSDIVPEDKEFRKKLQLERLEQVLKIHEQENGSQQFSRICLFCKQVFSQHSKLFDHMAFDHNFSVGQPANLVFVNKESHDYLQVFFMQYARAKPGPLTRQKTIKKYFIVFFRYSKI